MTCSEKSTNNPVCLLILNTSNYARRQTSEAKYNSLSGLYRASVISV